MPVNGISKQLAEEPPEYTPTKVKMTSHGTEIGYAELGEYGDFVSISLNADGAHLFFSKVDPVEDLILDVVNPCELTFSHTRNFCGISTCRES